MAGIKSPKTKKDYLKNFERFKKKCDISNHNEFLELSPKKIQIIVEDYVLNLVENEHPNSVPTFYYPIQAFLEMNDVMINFKKIRRLFPQKVKTAVERGWTTEEIRTMLNGCPNLRTRAAIHVENASGGRVGVYEDLRIKHLIEIKDERYGKCYAIVGYAESKEEYMTFLTPEATKELDAYLDSRKGNGEIFTPETPVFVTKKGEPKICLPKNIANSVYYAAKKAGLRDPTTKKGSHFAIPSNHGFRHRFNEIIKTSNLLNPHEAEKLMSHSSKLIPLDTIYYNPSMETLFHEYKKIISLIMIDDSERDKIEIVKKEEVNQELTQLNDKLKEQLDANTIAMKELVATKFKVQQSANLS